MMMKSLLPSKIKSHKSLSQSKKAALPRAKKQILNKKQNKVPQRIKTRLKTVIIKSFIESIKRITRSLKEKRGSPRLNTIRPNQASHRLSQPSQLLQLICSSHMSKELLLRQMVSLTVILSHRGAPLREDLTTLLLPLTRRQIAIAMSMLVLLPVT